MLNRNLNEESGKKKNNSVYYNVKKYIHKVNLWKNKGKDRNRKWLDKKKERSTQTFQRLSSLRQVKLELKC